ncbi:hypothetical protein F4777DRAFT_576100 [Nemania sp. FL0916]|nr:hypothetical protein F4777DRAFT_576100 [Nemania sp. FL0916]
MRRGIALFQSTITSKFCCGPHTWSIYSDSWELDDLPREMDALKQHIAEIDSAIIEARRYLEEAETRQEIEERQNALDQLEADLVAEQAKLDALRQEEEGKK